MTVDFHIWVSKSKTRIQQSQIYLVSKEHLIQPRTVTDILNGGQRVAHTQKKREVK